MLGCLGDLCQWNQGEIISFIYIFCRWSYIILYGSCNFSTLKVFCNINQYLKNYCLYCLFQNSWKLLNNKASSPTCYSLLASHESFFNIFALFLHLGSLHVSWLSLILRIPLKGKQNQWTENISLKIFPSMFRSWKTVPLLLCYYCAKVKEPSCH